jgi:hypothetical protein
VIQFTKVSILVTAAIQDTLLFRICILLYGNRKQATGGRSVHVFIHEKEQNISGLLKSMIAQSSETGSPDKKIISLIFVA